MTILVGWSGVGSRWCVVFGELHDNPEDCSKQLLRDAFGIEGEDGSGGEEGQQEEIAGEDVFAGEVELHQEFGRNGGHDGADFEGSQNVFVERGNRQVRHDVEAVGDAEGVGDGLIVYLGEGTVTGARAGVGVGGGIFERGVIGGDVEGEERGERASEAVSADGERGGRLLPGERGERSGDGRRAGGRTRDQQIVHVGKAVFGVPGAGEERARNQPELGVVDPLENAFGAAKSGDGVSGGRLEDEADGNLDLGAKGRDIGGEVVGEDRGDDLVGGVVRAEAGVDGLAGMVGEVVRRHVVRRFHQLSELDGFAEVHDGVPFL